MKYDKKYYIITFIVMLLCISIGFAVLNTTLNINGKSHISKNTWDIHFDNIKISDGSVEADKIPTIENPTTVDFEAKLNLPGDYYEFTVDVINDGTIDAMIESVIKEPELTNDQKKYLNYIIEYQNGEQLAAKQLVKVGEFVRLKVRVELRKDILATDLPEVGNTLYLGFTLNYVQADKNGNIVNGNGVEIVKVINGDLDTIGSEIAIGDEHFYITSSDETSITMLAKYNLYVGGTQNSRWIAYGDEATGIQDSTMKGYVTSGQPYYGTTLFSEESYWTESSKLKSEYGASYPCYVYDSNSQQYSYVENYKNYLENQGIDILEARLIAYEELENLGCNIERYSCTDAPEWIYSSTYWSGSAADWVVVWHVMTNGEVTYSGQMGNSSTNGVRPIIKISKDLFN